MEKLSLAQLRMILRAMSPHELEDMVCALYRSSVEAAAFFNRCYNTEEYVERLVDTYKAKLQIQFSCMGSCGSLAAARRSLNEFTRAVFENSLFRAGFAAHGGGGGGEDLLFFPGGFCPRPRRWK